jgi:hypothetical protein
LITKFSFENSISDSKNGITGGVGTDVSYAPGREAYQGSSSSFIAYNNVANPLIIIKALLFLCGLKQTHIQEEHILFMLPKPLIGVISSH